MTAPLPAAQTEWPQVAPNQIESFFASPEVSARKDEICDIGRRLWQRAYVDGNGGNISARVAADLVLCTPTLTSKGFMKPADLCLVDMAGVQKAGIKKRTSEVLLHLEMFKAQPAAMSCVHAHPPYATGFAVAGVSPPSCMVPEMEVFCGEVPVAPYGTPGTIEMSRTVAALVGKHNTILMGNHGVVSWGQSIEDAYFKMEIIDAYCRIVMVARQVASEPNLIPAPKLRELLTIKQTLGMPDSRFELNEGELDDRAGWRPELASDTDTEALIRRITDEVVRALRK
jgi:L-fuculose-phosphate aldolase